MTLYRRACFVPALAFALGACLAVSATAAERRAFVEAKAEGGELRYINNVPVLIVAGTPEEIGRQKAALTAAATKHILGFPAAMLKYFGAEQQLPKVLRKCRQLYPQFPADHAAEMKAFAKQANINEDLCIAGNTVMDVYRDGLGCSSLAVEPARSQTGKLLFARNLDFPSLGLLDKYGMLTVHRPKGKHAFVSVGWPGMIGVLSGMNDAGLCLAVHVVSTSADEAALFNERGMPFTLCFRRMLEECATVAEAEKVLRDSPRTTMLNLGVCDLKTAAVFELTPKTVVVRPANEGMVCCTNHFRTKPLSVTNDCWRFKVLDQSRGAPKLSVADLEKKLHEVSQTVLTVQSMVFEPGDLRLHVALGAPPVTRGPYREINLKELFGPETKQR